MRRLALALLPLALGSCNKIEFRVVTIKPIFGWVDGCNTVKIQGSGFDTDVAKDAVTLGGHALTEFRGVNAADLSQIDSLDSATLCYEDTATSKQVCTGDLPRLIALDQGYDFFGRVPPGDKEGFVDLSATSDSLTSPVAPDAYFYISCPEAPHVDTVSPSTGVHQGDTIEIDGCSLTQGAYRVQIGTAAPVDLTQVCGTAIYTFTAPAAPPLPADTAADTGAGGDTAGPPAYPVVIVDSTGAVVWPPACIVDTAETGGDTAGPKCEGATMSYGG